MRASDEGIPARAAAKQAKELASTFTADRLRQTYGGRLTLLEEAGRALGDARAGLGESSR